eukprot:127394-Rhodomonas_salina.1
MPRPTARTYSLRARTRKGTCDHSRELSTNAVEIEMAGTKSIKNERRACESNRIRQQERESTEMIRPWRDDSLCEELRHRCDIVHL